MRRPRVYIIAAEQLPDGRRIEAFNRESYESIATRLKELGMDPVYPNHAIEGGDAPDFHSVIYDRCVDLQTCDMAILVPSFEDCQKARKMKRTAEMNGMKTVLLMQGFDRVREEAFNHIGKRA